MADRERRYTADEVQYRHAGHNSQLVIRDEAQEVMKKLEADAQWKQARDELFKQVIRERAKQLKGEQIKAGLSVTDRLKLERALKDSTGQRKTEVDEAISLAVTTLGQVWGYGASETMHRPSWFSFKFQFEQVGFGSSASLYIAQKTGYPGTQRAMHRHAIPEVQLMAVYLQNGAQGLTNFIIAEGEAHLVDCVNASKVGHLSQYEVEEAVKHMPPLLTQTNIDTGKVSVINALPTKEEISTVATRAVKRTVRRPDPGKHKGQTSAASQKHKLLCPTHNEPLGYNAERGRYECPQRANGCAIVHRPPKEVSDEPVLGKAPLDLRIVVTSPDDRIAPQVFLMAQNNVFVDITEHVKHVEMNGNVASAVSAARTPGQPNYVDRDEVTVTIKLPRTVVIGYDETDNR